MGHVPSSFAKNAPFFIMKEGDFHQYFGVSVEVHFSAAGSDGAVTKCLIRRCFNVQAYEHATTAQTPASIKTDTTPSPTVIVEDDTPEPAPTSEEEPSTEPEQQPTTTEEPATEPEQHPTTTEEPATEPEQQPATTDEPATVPEQHVDSTEQQ